MAFLNTLLKACSQVERFLDFSMCLHNLANLPFNHIFSSDCIMVDTPFLQLSILRLLDFEKLNLFIVLIGSDCWFEGALRPNEFFFLFLFNLDIILPSQLRFRLTNNYFPNFGEDLFFWRSGRLSSRQFLLEDIELFLKEFQCPLLSLKFLK